MRSHGKSAKFTQKIKEFYIIINNVYGDSCFTQTPANPFAIHFHDIFDILTEV